MINVKMKVREIILETLIHSNNSLMVMRNMTSLKQLILFYDSTMLIQYASKMLIQVCYYGLSIFRHRKITMTF